MKLETRAEIASAIQTLYDEKKEMESTIINLENDIEIYGPRSDNERYEMVRELKWTQNKVRQFESAIRVLEKRLEKLPMTNSAVGY